MNLHKVSVAQGGNGCGRIRGWLKWCDGVIAIPQGTSRGSFTYNIDQHKACTDPGSNPCGHMTLGIVHPPKQW